MPSPLNIIHLCDVMATTGYLCQHGARPGTARHLQRVLPLRADPDGHRVELYASDYLTVDPDFEPIRWSLRDPRRQTLWGTPAPRSWFEEGTVFPNTPVGPPVFSIQPVAAD